MCLWFDDLHLFIYLVVLNLCVSKCMLLLLNFISLGDWFWAIKNRADCLRLQCLRLAYTISENDLNIYADDTYLIVPSSNSHTVSLELDHISEWAQCNNLMLNTAKSMEIIIHKPGVLGSGNLSVPQPTAGVTRCSSLKILGVTLTDTLSFECCRTVCPNRLCPSHTKVSWT